MATEGTISGASGSFRFKPSYQAAQLDGSGDLLPLELGVRIELLEQLLIIAHLATFTECINPSRLELRASLAGMPDYARCSSALEETVDHAFYYCE